MGVIFSTPPERVKGLLAKMGNPQHGLRVIHVAGTNGKGSVCAMLARILQEAGYRVGLFTSPHLLSPGERIAVNGAGLSEVALSAALARAGQMATEKLHFFEAYVLAAYHTFAEAGVDFAVMETGIGGRLDPTNAIEAPALTVITAIGYDHRELLGDTLEQIAREKAGIIKPNVPVVLPAQNIPVLAHTAVYKNAPQYKTHNVTLTDITYGINGTVFSATLPGAAYDGLTLSLLGRHQTENAAQALLGIQALRDRGITVPDVAVYEGLKRVRWPGRFEVIPGEPTLVLDGAHNPCGAERLAQALGLYFPGKTVVLLLGMVKEKDCGGIVRALEPAAAHIVCTCPGTPRAVPAAEAAAYIRQKPCTAVPLPREALRKAAAIAGRDGVVAVTGSLYLIGDIIKYMNKKAEDSHD
jgi:dihydrofolate synthase/folylpolyglutamate synthase